MSFEQDFLAAVKKLQEEARQRNQQADELLKKLRGFSGQNLRPEELYEQLFGSPPTSSQIPPKQPRFSSVADMMHKLDAQKKRQVVTKPMDPKTRIREINHELDIIRGRVPTPKGYTVNPLRAKQLMAELKQLSKP